MTKSELIDRLAAKQTQLSFKDVELVVKTVLEHMAQSLAQGKRIEIRGFGSFSLHYRAPRTGRNPKTGDSVELAGKYVPHFKPGKELRERVNEGASMYPIANSDKADDDDKDDDTSSSDSMENSSNTMSSIS
ncbi:MAG: integration host factor subunit beta [Pseudomonadota bacterium]